MTEQQLKRELYEYNHHGYEGIFLTKQWDQLVELIGDEEATAWYKTLDGRERGI